MPAELAEALRAARRQTRRDRMRTVLWRLRLLLRRLRLRGSSGLPSRCPPYPGFCRYTATRPGQAGKPMLHRSDARPWATPQR